MRARVRACVRVSPQVHVCVAAKHSKSLLAALQLRLSVGRKTDRPLHLYIYGLVVHEFGPPVDAPAHDELARKVSRRGRLGWRDGVDPSSGPAHSSSKLPAECTCQRDQSREHTRTRTAS